MIKKIGKFFIRVYVVIISPFLPHVCRYNPTCSKFMMECIDKFGFVKGILLGFRRILKCRPKQKYGKDIPPENIKGDYKWLM